MVVPGDLTEMTNQCSTSTFQADSKSRWAYTIVYSLKTKSLTAQSTEQRAQLTAASKAASLPSLSAVPGQQKRSRGEGTGYESQCFSHQGLVYLW